MEQTKAVWKVEAFSVKPGFLISKNQLVIVPTEVNTSSIAARLNATEGLNVEALPELIEAAKALTEPDYLNLDEMESGIILLQSALNKLTRE